jgi:hypothetical protein
MQPPKIKIEKKHLKIAGGVLLLCCSAWFVYYRTPKRAYVSVNADKPRPAAAKPAPAAAPAPAKPAPAAEKPAAAAPAAAPAAEVKVSTVPTVDSIYTAGRLRDPFARWGAGRSASKPFSLEDFSIHKLSLRGIMRDAGSDFALFADSESGAGFLLRKGKLYDPKKKAVPGIAGAINFKTKTVTLTAPDGDVQVFRLGEAEE